MAPHSVRRILFDDQDLHHVSENDITKLKKEIREMLQYLDQCKISKLANHHDNHTYIFSEPMDVLAREIESIECSNTVYRVYCDLKKLVECFEELLSTPRHPVQKKMFQLNNDLVDSIVEALQKILGKSHNTNCSNVEIDDIRYKEIVSTLRNILEKHLELANDEVGHVISENENLKKTISKVIANREKFRYVVEYMALELKGHIGDAFVAFYKEKTSENVHASNARGMVATYVLKHSLPKHQAKYERFMGCFLSSYFTTCTGKRASKINKELVSGFLDHLKFILLQCKIRNKKVHHGNDKTVLAELKNETLANDFKECDDEEIQSLLSVLTMIKSTFREQVESRMVNEDDVSSCPTQNDDWLQNILDDDIEEDH